TGQRNPGAPAQPCSARALMRVREVETPWPSSSVNAGWPPKTLSTRNWERAEVPCGVSRRSTSRVPPASVGSSSNAQMEVFSMTRLAIRRPGSNSTTFAVVGQISLPCLLMLSERVPAVVRPPRASTLTAWLLHCGALRTSETISQTRAGGASISIELSMGAFGLDIEVPLASVVVDASLACVLAGPGQAAALACGLSAPLGRGLDAT